MEAGQRRGRRLCREQQLVDCACQHVVKSRVKDGRLGVRLGPLSLGVTVGGAGGSGLYECECAPIRALGYDDGNSHRLRSRVGPSRVASSVLLCCA